MWSCIIDPRDLLVLHQCYRSLPVTIPLELFNIVYLSRPTPLKLWLVLFSFIMGMKIIEMWSATRYRSLDFVDCRLLKFPYLRSSHWCYKFSNRQPGSCYFQYKSLKNLPSLISSLKWRLNGQQTKYSIRNKLIVSPSTSFISILRQCLFIM